MQPRERTKLTAFSVSQWVFWWYRSVRIWSSPRDKKGTDRKCPQYWKAHIYAQTSRYLVPNDFNKSSIKSKGQLPDLSSSILPQWEAFWTVACTACWWVLHIHLQHPWLVNSVLQGCNHAAVSDIQVTRHCFYRKASCTCQGKAADASAPEVPPHLAKSPGQCSWWQLWHCHDAAHLGQVPASWVPVRTGQGRIC